MSGVRRREFRFPRSARMRRRRDFARTMRAGEAVAAEAFVLYRLRAPGERRLLGIVCGRRVGNAARRNRVKRRLREIFRTHPDDFRDGLWFVVVAKPAITARDYHRLAAELEAAWAALANDNDG